MTVTQSALKIFLQHYYDIDWLHTKHLKSLLFHNRKDSFAACGYLNLLEIVLKSLQFGVAGTALEFISSITHKTKDGEEEVEEEEQDHSIYWSLLLTTHYLTRAVKARKEGKASAAKYWEKVAKHISVSSEREVMLNTKAYIQAELEEAKTSKPIREREVKLWSFRLERLNESGERDQMKQDMNMYGELTLREALLEVDLARKDSWIKYCQRMSRQAKLAGDEETSRNWEVVVPLTWGLKLGSTSVRIAKTVYALIAKTCSHRYPTITGPLWNAVALRFRQERMKLSQDTSNHATSQSDNKEDEMDYESAENTKDGDESDEEDISDNSEEEEEEFQTNYTSDPDFIKDLLAFEKIKRRPQRLQRKGTTKAYLQELSSRDDNFVRRLFTLAKKTEECLCRYLARNNPTKILIDHYWTEFLESRDSFTKLLDELEKLMYYGFAIIQHYDALSQKVSTYVAELPMPSRSDVVVKVSTILTEMLQTIDRKLDYYLSLESTEGLRISFELSYDYQDLNFLDEAVVSIGQSMELMRARRNQLDTLPTVCFRYGVLLLQGILMNHSPNQHYVLSKLYNLFSITWKKGHPQEEHTERILIPLWEALVSLELFPSPLHLSREYVSQPVPLHERIWMQAVSYIFVNLQSLSNIHWSFRWSNNRLVEYYLFALANAGQNQSLLATLYLSVAERVEMRPSGEIDWLLAAIEAYKSNDIVLGSCHQAAADLYNMKDLDRVRLWILMAGEMIRIFRSTNRTMSDREKLEWKAVADIHLRTLDQQSDRDREVVTKYCACFKEVSSFAR